MTSLVDIGVLLVVRMAGRTMRFLNLIAFTECWRFAPLGAAGSVRPVAPALLTRASIVRKGPCILWSELVAAFAMSFPSILRSNAFPAKQILFWRDRFKMLGIHAAAISAQVICNPIIRHLADENEIGNSAGRHSFALEHQVSIAARIYESSPVPAARFGINLRSRANDRPDFAFRPLFSHNLIILKLLTSVTGGQG